MGLRTLYHATTPAALDAILAEGLAYGHLAADPAWCAHLIGMWRGEAVVLAVEVDDADLTEGDDHEPECGHAEWALVRRVPPERLRVTDHRFTRPASLGG